MSDRIADTARRLLEAARDRGMWVTADVRIGEQDAADLLGWSSDSLKNARSEGRGPRWYRLGGAGHRVTYRLDDLAAWIESLAEG